jgi:hypothetical protein
MRCGPATSILLGAWLVSLAATTARAQGYRLRLDGQAQRAAFRGVTQDSILATDARPAPTGGLQTADGFAVRCPPGNSFCFFFRPGPALRGGPVVTSADLLLWGLGVSGLSVRVNGRAGFDLGDGEVWPGTEPNGQLIEAYAEYVDRRFTVRGGRQLLASRLGIVGFDGGKATLHPGRYGLQAEAYVGLGLARATAIPLTSPALDPLDEFQPRRRQILAGAAMGWSSRLAEVRLDYQREVDRESRHFASERTAIALDFQPRPRWSLVAGAEYDLANTWFGNADATLRYTAPWITVLGGIRQYRPHFDLWTIWGAFSPVPYHAVNSAVWIRPLRGVELRARWERYAFSPAETETPLVSVEDDGHRVGLGISYSPIATLSLDAGYREEHGPGASSHGFEGTITVRPVAGLALVAYGSTLERPLEFRFQESSVDALGFDAEWRPSERLRLAVGAAHYAEARDRPDAAAFDWNQTRLMARVTLVLRSQADNVPLPPALPPLPRAGVR